MSADICIQGLFKKMNLFIQWFPFVIFITFISKVLRLSVIKKKKVLGPPKREYDSSDPDYAVWLPPEGQCSWRWSRGREVY